MKVLWCGDGGPKTGFEYVSRGFLTELHARNWDIVHLAIGANGDPTDYPWPVYPALPGGDHLGIGRIRHLIEREQPDVVVLLNDSWAAPLYFEQIPTGTKVVVYPPVDARNQPAAKLFNGVISHVIAPTQFGVDELVAGGYTGPTSVIGYGTDVTKFGGLTRLKARQALGFPPKLQRGFIVSNINRNAPRKRLDLTMRAFSEWITTYEIPNAFLLLHCDPHDSWGWDLLGLVKLFGLQKRVIFTGDGGYASDEKMRYVYAAGDVQISTTVGEGWGLCHSAGMASGVTQILPDYAALGEWAKDGALLYPIIDTQIAVGQINTVWTVPHIERLKILINDVYEGILDRDALGQQGRTHISQKCFSWPYVGQQMDIVLNEVARG
jgi:D-inositol-3-phosphate glycosyltransferase